MLPPINGNIISLVLFFNLRSYCTIESPFDKIPINIELTWYCTCDSTLLKIVPDKKINNTKIIDNAKNFNIETTPIRRKTFQRLNYRYCDQDIILIHHSIPKS